MSSESDNWEPELLESQLHGHDPENELPDLILDTVQRKRGPKKLPLMWSRVISVSEDSYIELGSYEIELDIQMLQSQPK